MNKLNVFNNAKLPWRYPVNWGRRVKNFFYSFKYAYQRITRGFSDKDVWNLDEYYLNLFSAAIRQLAQYHNAYPGNEEFDTDEKWTEYLYKMSFDLKMASEWNDLYPTPAADAWYDGFQKGKYGFGEKNLQSEKMQEEAKNINELRERHLQEGLNAFSHVFRHLWD